MAIWLGFVEIRLTPCVPGRETTWEGNCSGQLSQLGFFWANYSGSEKQVSQGTRKKCDASWWTRDTSVFVCIVILLTRPTLPLVTFGSACAAGLWLKLCLCILAMLPTRSRDRRLDLHAWLTGACQLGKGPTHDRIDAVNGLPESGCSALPRGSWTGLACSKSKCDKDPGSSHRQPSGAAQALLQVLGRRDCPQAENMKDDLVCVGFCFLLLYLLFLGPRFGASC